MALIFQLYKREKTKAEKFKEFKKNEQIVQSRLIKALHVTPTVLSNVSLMELYYLHLNLSKFYLMEKICNLKPQNFMVYYVSMKKNINGIFYLLKLKNKNFFKLTYDVTSCKSVLVLFEKFLKPIQNWVVTKTSDEISMKKHCINNLIVWKSAGFRTYMNLKFSRLAVNLIDDSTFLPQLDYLYEDICPKEIIENEKRIYVNNTMDTMVFLENFLLIKDCFPYKYINLDDFLQFSKDYNDTELNINEYLSLIVKHNENLKMLNIPQNFLDLSNLNLKKSLITLNLKVWEEKRILCDLHNYLEFSAKSILNLIEMILFKFELILMQSFENILNLLYESINNSNKFLEFYNLLIKEINNIKYQLNLYTIEFLVDFLEFLQYLAGSCEIYPLMFETSINNFYKTHGLKLRLFRFNFFKRIELFEVNNSQYYDTYYRDIAHNSIKKNFKNSEFFINLPKEHQVTEYPNLNQVKSYKVMYYFFKYITIGKFQLKLWEFPLRYRYRRKKLLKFFLKKEKKLTTYLESFYKFRDLIMSIYLSHKCFIYYYINFYIYVNIFKLAETRYKTKMLKLFLLKKNIDHLETNLTDTFAQALKLLQNKMELHMNVIKKVHKHNKKKNQIQIIKYNDINSKFFIHNFELLNAKDSSFKGVVKEYLINSNDINTNN